MNKKPVPSWKSVIQRLDPDFIPRNSKNCDFFFNFKISFIPLDNV